MNNLILAGLIGGSAYLLWRNKKKSDEAGETASFQSLLMYDDKNVADANKVNIAQTALNLTAVKKRNNQAEILSQASLLQSKGYVYTASALLQTLKDYPLIKQNFLNAVNSDISGGAQLPPLTTTGMLVDFYTSAYITSNKDYLTSLVTKTQNDKYFNVASILNQRLTQLLKLGS
jgi:hypothetical protein